MSRQAKTTILSAISFMILFAGIVSARAQKSVAAPSAQTKVSLSASPQAVRTIVVSLKDRRLALLENGIVKAVYPAAVGKASTPSPTGTFTIVNHVINPTYYHHGVVIPPGPENPVGNRWMGLSIAGYGIHGTNVPRSIGKAVSHGCIRLSRRDLDKLFAQVQAGDTVEIIGEPNAQTIAIFDKPSTPGAAATQQPMLAAKTAPEAAPTKPASITMAMATAPSGQ